MPVPPRSWRESLNRIRSIRLEVAQLDPRRGMPIAPPPPATETAIASAERRLKRPLPPTYRALLEQHDGFPGLFHGTRLLGARQLRQGTFVDVARMVMGEAVGGDRSKSLLPFAIDESAEMIAAWDLRSPAAFDGELEIIVWVNEIAERVDGFPDFLELVLSLLCAERDALDPPEAVTVPARGRTAGGRHRAA